MHSHYAHIQVHKKSFINFICGALLLLAALFFWTRLASANEITYDPYADSVAASSTLTLDPNNAVGAPNGTNATLAGVGASLTLDMGQGEEGTQSLKVYVGQVNAQVNVDIAFLDSNQAVISSENRQLGVDVNPSTQNFAYNWTNFGKAYRYVKISTPAGGGVNVDAIEATGYIGSTPTQDTDGDGRPDRSEQQNGTNPLVADPPLTSSGSNPAAPSSGNTGPSSNGGRAGTVSDQVNPPPAASNDNDKDGMPNDWETAHGLNPNDPSDATGDLDKDGLLNITEYQIGSDPQKADTDGDGMPDKWEYDHGLNVNKNDADGDPDGDFLTNLGEYRHNTDPHKADDLYKVFATACTTKRKVSTWEWIVFALLIAAGLLAWLRALFGGPFDPPTSDSSTFYRARYSVHQRLTRAATSDS